MRVNVQEIELETVPRVQKYDLTVKNIALAENLQKCRLSILISSSQDDVTEILKETEEGFNLRLKKQLKSWRTDRAFHLSPSIDGRKSRKLLLN